VCGLIDDRIGKAMSPAYLEGFGRIIPGATNKISVVAQALKTT